MRRLVFTAFALFVVATSPNVGHSASTESSYLSLAADTLVSSRTTLLTQTTTLSSRQWVYVQSDGRYFPGAGRAANTAIFIDGVRASNDAFIDWRNSTNPQQHGFNVIAAKGLSKGAHTIELVAERIDDSYYVGAGTNLSVMVRPAPTIRVASVAHDSDPYAFTTNNAVVGTPLPSAPLVTCEVHARHRDIVAVASGRAYKYNSDGDAMLGISLNGANHGNDESSWTSNDMFPGAETQAPLYAHAYFRHRSGRSLVSLDATEFPWMGTEDTVSYVVGYGTTLIAMTGRMVVAGSAPISSAVNNWWDYICIGSSSGWPGCPVAGSDALLAEATVNIPRTHNGVVLFEAKSRELGDDSDPGGTVLLWISIDGQPRSNTAIQQLASPNSVSGRTLTASVLTAGAGALSPGPHVVTVWARAQGSFAHLSMVRDLPLIWFD